MDPLGGRSTRDQTAAKSLAVTPFGSGSTIGIRPTYRYIWLNKTNRICGSVDQFSCAEKAFFANVTATRGCRSLAEIALPVGGSTTACTTRYTMAEANESLSETSQAAWNKFLAACPIQCDETMFESLTFSSSANSEDIHANIYSQPVLFFTVTEYYLMNGAAFLNAFGALIGK